MTIINDARAAWNLLNGIICVYKPAELSVQNVRHKIVHKLCSGLNEMKCREPIQQVNILGDPTKYLEVVVEPNLADHVLVVGPRYQMQDVVMSWSNFLGYNTSGVLLFGIRSGTKWAKHIRENHPVRSYRISGKFGTATDNCFHTGKVVEKSTWRHARLYHLEQLLASMQAAHQRKMFDLCGVDIQSQTAYELAVKGPIRPLDKKIPLLYGIKCVEFEAPRFVLEIQCVNEYESYLTQLVHEIGLKLHSTAHCTGLQCIRHACFTLDDAVLPKHWELEHLLNNLLKCNDLLQEHEKVLKQDQIQLGTG